MSILFLPSLFFLSFLPLWVSVVFIDVLSILESGANLWTEAISLVLIVLGTLVSLLTVITQMRRQMASDFTTLTIKKVSKQKVVTAEYLLFYVLPLFAFDFTKWRQVVLFLIFFCTLVFLCLKHHYVYANIVLEICGYTCYECTLQNSDQGESEAVVVSTEELNGMLNHEISYVSLGGGYGLHFKAPSA